MDKEGLYQQIQDFNNTRTDSSDKSSKTYAEAYLYVQDDEAIDKAEFIQELIKEGLFKNSYDKILDLTFGSGNLTSHIVFDNDIKYKNIMLNDINTHKTNQNLDPFIENCTLLHNDVLKADDFEEVRADLVIVNPQIGGSYTDGNILDQKERDEKNEDVLGKLYETLDKFYNDGSVIIFYGKHKDFTSLLEEVNFYKYMSGVQNMFVTSQYIEENICFERDEENFIINEDCDKQDESDDVIDSFDELVSKTESYQLNEGNSSNEEAFKEWWFSSTYNSVDGKPFSESTKKNYFRALQQLRIDLAKYGFNNFDLFIINNIDDLNQLLERLEKGDLKKYNKRHSNTDTSNGLKQYMRFLQDNGNSNSHKSPDTSLEEDVFSDTQKGKQDFPYKNILFKGVPGTGKSRAIEIILKDHLKIIDSKENFLRINIHSASSNADLMQGIGISSEQGQIAYKEKQGLILDIIKRASYHPKQAFALILEEVQENSLNELIGDLIYLIEDEKRAKDITPDNKRYSYKELVEKIIEDRLETHYVEIPYLVNDSTDYRKMIMPDNLYIFCTSNYRDDKKVIEDNLLRRFEVIEIYPKEKVVIEAKAREFFKSLNDEILEQMGDEIHPDRFMIGHATWKYVNDDRSFYKALLKLVIEFKDIREIEFEKFRNILEKTKFPDYVKIELKNSYFELIKDLQTAIDYDFLD